MWSTSAKPSSWDIVSPDNWAGFNNWWQRKSKQMWLADKQEALVHSWTQRVQKTLKPLYKHVHTLKCSHTNSQSPCLECFLYSFSLQASHTSVRDHMYRGVEPGSLCCVLQSILPEGYSPPTGCNEPAWAASVINIMGRQSSEKQTHCGALVSIWRVHPQQAGGKKKVESSQISNWSQNVDCAGLRAL